MQIHDCEPKAGFFHGDDATNLNAVFFIHL